MMKSKKKYNINLYLDSTELGLFFGYINGMKILKIYI